ncbi:MFS transporter [uncultured Paraglaciecola sp.]|uniref:MFS transporter n=1 Tax=uncultured Paraglaciecola sp. TaxID=1765024 RepID=UPI00263832F5|nr:MFS transporter [uncultured Paraglaciecola sp.]
MPANVWLLTLIQALAMSTGTMLVLAGGVLGAQLTPDPKWSTLPLAMSIVGTACGVVPITRLMQHFGRKPIFIGATLFGVMVTLFAASSIANSNFWGLVASAFLLGMVLSAIQQIRFAAMESVGIDLMPKAASTVLLGGLVAAILGPELVTWGNLVTEQDFVGAFYLMAGLLVLCSLLFTRIKNTHVTIDKSADTGRLLLIIAKQPIFILAVSSSVVGYALMSFIMTATPVHMHVHEAYSLQETKWVIQSHIFAMFFPSIFSGWLITKLGTSKILFFGLSAYICTILVALVGNEWLNYWVALVLLGIGWNFLFVGGTVLLAQSYQPNERFKVQGLNEFLVFGCQAMAALSAGVLLNIIDWRGLLLVSFAIITAQLLMIIWQQNRQKRTSIPQQTF